MLVEGKHQILFEKPRKKKELDRFPFQLQIQVPSSHDPPGGLTGRIFPVGAPCPEPWPITLGSWPAGSAEPELKITDGL